MEILLIFIIFILVLYTFSPLFKKNHISRGDVKSKIQSLRKEKSSLEEALEELKLELSTGVIDKKEALELKEIYEKRIDEIKREIENIVMEEVEERKKRKK